MAPPAVALPPQSASQPPSALPPLPDGADGGPWPEICEQFGLHLLVLAEQLRLSLDELEADEADPERLEQLYRIDHGVTRMRRASRDLRVLAGRGEEALDGPVTSLLDVIRMAASAIDRYGQVQVGKAAELAVVGYAADDVGSLMAALLENATQYSPETVTVSAHLMGDGAVMFRIEDSGIGMSPEQVAALNEMLSGPVPDVDERTGRHTGFPVAHRIARRHMITVRLASRPAPRTGTLAMVTVPPHLLCEIPEEEAIHPAAPAARPVTLVGSRVPGPRERAALAGLTARHVAPGAPGELPRRESVSLRGDRPAPTAANARAGMDAEMPTADQAAARRAFAADLAAFAQASAALGDQDGTEGRGGAAAGDSLPWDHSSGSADGRATQEGTVLDDRHRTRAAARPAGLRMAAGQLRHLHAGRQPRAHRLLRRPATRRGSRDVR